MACHIAAFWHLIKDHFWELMPFVLDLHKFIDAILKYIIHLIQDPYNNLMLMMIMHII